ncbi:MAG TPA: tetratricopeptide repeat protein, partial [Patescibacteria group bacterium]|nr:tetratricopeptide repeat protein [Patescibacteria group bacterium]
ALSRAELDSAFAHLVSAQRWQPGDSPTFVLIGRVISQAQANGLPLEALEGHQATDEFGVGAASVIQGIAVSPADAFAWFALVDVYEGFRTARVRYQAMKRAGEAALTGAKAPPPSEKVVGLDGEDQVSVAAALQALELEPNFYFYRDYLAKLYWDRGLETEAANEIRQSLAQWPRLEAHPSLNDESFVKGLAPAILEGIAAASPNRFAGPAMAARARASILERLERRDEAIQAWEELRRVGDRSLVAECDLNIGRLEIDAGRLRESIPVLQSVSERIGEADTAGWALYYLGQAHSRLGEHAEAAAVLRRHLELVPDSLPGSFLLAEEEEIAGRGGEAERLLIAAVLMYPSEPSTYMKVIESMRKHGKAKQALSYAEALGKFDEHREEADRLIEQLQIEAVQKPH